MVTPSALPAVPLFFNFAVDVVDKWASTDARLRAMQFVKDNNSPPLNLTYAYFSQRSHQAAHLLQKLGAKKGDRVFVMLSRVPAWWEIATATIRCGLVLCPCTTLAVEKDIEFRLVNTQATVFVGDTDSIEKFLRIRARCPSVKIVLKADGLSQRGVVQYQDEIDRISRHPFKDVKTKSSDPALIYFTSGTTGLPKMVLHNQVSYPLGHAITGMRWLLLKPGKLYWNLSEQGWAKAAWSWFGAWNAGAALFIDGNMGAFSAQRLLDHLHRYSITTLCAPPTVYRQLVVPSAIEYMTKNMPRCLEHCTGAGEPLNAEVIKIWSEKTGIEIRDGYGQTETVLVAGNFADNKVKLGSMGKPAPGVPLEIVDDNGWPIADGLEGDIAIKAVDENGDQLMCIYVGYITKDNVVTRKTRPCISPEGETRGQWHLTGDRAYRDTDGYLWFVGRDDDVINASGYRIGPFEVESTLKEHPAVKESAVVSSPDPIRGDVVKAFIVLNSNYTNRSTKQLIVELQEFCKRAAAPYKYPRKIQFVSEAFLPKTISGKIKRSELRKLEAQNGLEKL
ncbi:hypothetical protein LTR10_023061 [Elasticomyces elasticus]|nr:hypothetical protein LTR10_023061 [Elasticomyces elasticus]